MKNIFRAKKLMGSSNLSGDEVVHSGSKRSPGARRLIAGFVSIEVVAGIAIIAAALIWEGVHALNMRERSQEVAEAQNIDQLAEAITGSKVANANGYGTGDLGAGLITNNTYPHDLSINGTTILNPFQQAYVLTGIGQTYSIGDPGLPPGTCSSLVIGETTKGTWATIAVNGTAIDPTTLSQQSAATACATTPNTVTLTSAN